MDVIWFAVFALLLAGYFALEGFDLGVGLLLPVLGRSRDRRDRMVAAMAPYVLANEVWLVALAGTLFGVYPLLEGPVLFGLYPVVVAMLLCWIVRDAGLWFRRRLGGPRWRAFWDGLVWLGSLGLAYGWGPALHGAATGSPLHPLGLMLGVVTALLMAFHGWTFLAWRAPALTGTARPGRALLVSAVVAALPALAVIALSAPHLLDHTTPGTTLNVLSLMVLPFAPVMLGAQVWVWRTFRPGEDAPRTPSFF